MGSELAGHNRPEIRDSIKRRFADTIAYIVTRPRHMAVNELLVRPTQQQA